jgi:hypothetical protein
MINQNKEIQEYFSKNGYVVIENFLSSDIANLFYQYSKTKVTQVDFKIEYDYNNYNTSWDGQFGDAQISGSYNAYGDTLMDTLLVLSLNAMCNFTGLDLNPTYSYWRFYQKGDILERHTDRSSCEVSTTICLGHDVSDVDQTKYPNYNWPMWVKNKEGNEIPIHLNPGDMIIYRGCDIEHWREKFIGLNHSQVFLHFNDKNGPYKGIYDGRPMIGIPKKFQKLGE